MKQKNAKIILPLSLLAIFGCNDQQKQKHANQYENIQINKMSPLSADSSFNKKTSSEISPKDFIDRERYCSYESTEIQAEVKKIIDAYNNKNLLDQNSGNMIPALKILVKTRNLTSSNPALGENLHACYYPELYLANAYVMNALRKVPFAPFNQETLMLHGFKGDPSENQNWNSDEAIKGSKFAKLNGMIRSSLIAEKILAFDEGGNVKPFRFYSIDNNKKVYLFGLQEEDKKESYYKQTHSLANALAAIGYYERALYRWNGIFTAEELNAQSSLPNDSLQEAFSEENTSETKTFSVKNIIAYDLILANEKARLALNNKFCSLESDAAKIPAHEISLCAEMKTIYQRAIQIDLKRLICTTGKKISQEKTLDDKVFNEHWEVADCDTFLTNNKNLENLYIGPKGNSFFENIPAYINTSKLNQEIEESQEILKNIKSDTLVYSTIQTQDYNNKKAEILDNIVSLKESLSIAKHSNNKAAEELAFYQFQKDTAKTMLEVSKLDLADSLREQKNQFQLYVNNLATLNRLNKLKIILTDNSNNKASLLSNYKNKLCGNESSCNQTGALAELSKLAKEKETASIYQWKNTCTRMVRQRNNIANAIGQNGCDLEALTEGVSLINDASKNTALVIQNIQRNSQFYSQRCQSAALSEVLVNSNNNELNDIIHKRVGENWYYADIQKRIEKLKHSYSVNSFNQHNSETKSKGNIKSEDTFKSKEDNKINTEIINDNKVKAESTSNISSTGKKNIESSTNSNTSSESTSSSFTQSTETPTYDSLMKSNFSFASTIAEAHINKLFFEEELFVNPNNKSKLSDPDTYCMDLYIEAKNSNFINSPKLLSVIEAEINKNQIELQNLQINYSLERENLDLEVVIKEKIANLDTQIKNIEISQFNLENVLGVIKNIKDYWTEKVKTNFTETDVDNYYKNIISTLNYNSIKNAKLKQEIQENNLKAAEKNVATAQVNLEMAKQQVENIKLAIDRANIRAQSKNLEYFLFTSISPNINTFSDNIHEIEYTQTLARKVIHLASSRIINMKPQDRNLTIKSFNNMISSLSNTKYACSYLASFDDALHCLNRVKILNSYFVPQMEFRNSHYDKDFIIQIYSKSLREENRIPVSLEEQEEDTKMLATLNETGMFDFNMNENFITNKISNISGEFDTDYYKSRIIGVVANIHMRGYYKSKYSKNSFKSSSKMAFLLHNGLSDHNSKGVCPEYYSNYAKQNYLNYMNEIYSGNMQSENINSEYLKFGKQLPHLFSKYTSQQLICDKNQIIQSLSVISPSSSIRYIDADNNIKPISFFAKSSDNFDFYNKKIRTMKWFEELKTNANSVPSKNEDYWQSLTGFITDNLNKEANLDEIIDPAIKCLDNGSNFTCEAASDIINQSFSGYPLLGEYKFIYAKHALDNFKYKKLDPSTEKSNIQGIELQFIISK